MLPSAWVTLCSCIMCYVFFFVEEHECKWTPARKSSSPRLWRGIGHHPSLWLCAALFLTSGHLHLWPSFSVAAWKWTLRLFALLWCSSCSRIYLLLRLVDYRLQTQMLHYNNPQSMKLADTMEPTAQSLGPMLLWYKLWWMNHRWSCHFRIYVMQEESLYCWLPVEGASPSKRKLRLVLAEVNDIQSLWSWSSELTGWLRSRTSRRVLQIVDILLGASRRCHRRKLCYLTKQN